ncbi:MAG: aldo/keto reductase [Verrucomicrobiota bacterium]
MKYNTLGKTGIKVSQIAYGGSSLGSEFGKIDESVGIASVHAALDQGINLIDTAPYYGRTTAETVLGKALKTVPRTSYYLATKVARYGKSIEEFDYSAQRVTRSVEESLQRLGVDYVDFIQVHDMEFGDLDQIVEETIPALRKIQSQGKARFVGITCLPVGLFKRVIDRIDVDQIQSYCRYCLNDTSLAELLPYFKQKEVAIFNSAPLAMRLLSAGGPPDWHPAPRALQEKAHQAAELCQKRGSDLSKLALQFALANSEIHTHILGTANPRRVLQNIRESEEPLDQELLRDVLEIFKPVHNMTWVSGKPENND